MLNIPFASNIITLFIFMFDWSEKLMEFSIAIRDLFIGDARMFRMAYIAMAICFGLSFSGILLECKFIIRKMKRIKKNFRFIINILIRVSLIILCLFIGLHMFRITPQEVIKTEVGKFYLEQNDEIKKLDPITIENEISSEDVQVLKNSGIYTGVSEVKSDKGYVVVEEWSISGSKTINNINVVVEKGIVE